MKIYRFEDLMTFVEEENVWRVREISNYKATFSGQPNRFKAVQARAGIPLAYAHWEGYAKNCAIAYLQYVSARRKPLKALGTGFWLGALRPAIDRLRAKPFDKAAQVGLIEIVLQSGEARFNSKPETIIDTRSNLSSEVLSEMCKIMSLDGTVFESDSSFIDKILLERRNNIAHGQNIEVDEDDFVEVANRTVALMQTFGNCIIDAAQKI